MGRHLKVHGELLGHRTRAELARRTMPVSDRPSKPGFTVTYSFDSREDAQAFHDWMAALFDEDRTECICHE